MLDNANNDDFRLSMWPNLPIWVCTRLPYER